jgi:hypothetical protein
MAGCAIHSEENGNNNNNNNNNKITLITLHVPCIVTAE